MQQFPRNAKNGQEMGRAKVFKNFIIGFYESYDYQY